MLQLLGYIFLIAVGIVIIKFGYALIMRFIALGVVAFIFVGCISGALSLLGYISSSTAWTISKWAFYIGAVLNIIEALSHPFDSISDAWEFTTDTDYSSGGSSYDNEFESSSSVNNSSYSGGGSTDVYAGRRCCGNCRWNTSPYRNNVVCNHNPAGAYNSVNDRCVDYVA